MAFSFQDKPGMLALLQHAFGNQIMGTQYLYQLIQVLCPHNLARSGPAMNMQAAAR